MEKEHQPDSMATITMKPEYPPSEVYSTSEPPPAYRHRSSSAIQIARIAALTIVASAFILGSFILASSWVSARASCHQLEQLDAMLDKELALEGRAYGNDALLPDEPLPIGNAHALHAAPPLPTLEAPASTSQTEQKANKEDGLNQAESKIDEEKLQKIDSSDSKSTNSESEESSESDSSAEEEDELDAIRPMFKMPIQFDLDELAGAFLQANNNQKGRMNCVVERRREEPMERRFPFNILGAFAPPRSSHAERVAIICHGGDEQRAINFPEPQSQVFAFPLSGPVRLPLRPQPDRAAPAAPPAPEHRPFNQQRVSNFPLPMPWESSEEQMGAPREMRIHVQRVIAIPSHNMPAQDNMSPFAPPPPPPQNMPEQNEQSAVMHQFVPQPGSIQELEHPEIQKMPRGGLGLPWGLTPEDIRVIQRTAEEAAAEQRRDQQIDNDMQEVKTIVNSLSTAESEGEEQEMPAPRAPHTLLLPQEMPAEERPHYVQPRSVRSVGALLNEKMAQFA